jgi:hypothetical protein
MGVLDWLKKPKGGDFQYRSERISPGGGTAVVADDVYLNLAGTRRGTLRMEFDSEPSRDEVLIRLESILGFPYFPTVSDRSSYLAHHATGAAESGRGLELELLGSPASRAACRPLLRAFIGDSLSEKIGTKLLDTLRDAERHSSSALIKVHGAQVLVLISTWPGRFSQAVTGLRGKWLREVDAILTHFKKMGADPSRIVALDYFVKDAEYEARRPAALELALSFLQVGSDALPREFDVVVLNAELLSDDDRSQLGIL